MTIIGRVTKDAVVKTLKSEKQVVSFSVCINDGYKKKGTDTWVSIPSFYNCSYWLSSNVASILKKGNLVELTGRISVNPYKDLQGEAQASLNFHVDSIKVHQVSKKEDVAVVAKAQTPVLADDLPF
jgi:single-strand DNA-binding protein